MSAPDYVEYVFLDYVLSSNFDSIAGDRWMPEAEMLHAFQAAMQEAFSEKGYAVGNRYREIYDKIFSDLSASGILQKEGDNFTGIYYKFQISEKDEFIKEILEKNPVAQRIKVLGTPALGRALKVLGDIEGWQSLNLEEQSEEFALDTNLTQSREAPAADRVVTFSDNQISDLEAQATEVIDTIAQQNQVDDQPGLREIVLGQLKAGRELIRAGSFRLHIIQLTLIETLQFLAKRYEREAVGGLAAALIAALLQHIGVGI